MSPSPRIASLVPSLTELVVALGLLPHLVARTGFCVHPADALRAVPKVGGTKDVRLDRLRGLAPTHVLVNVDENRREVVDELRSFIPEVIVTHPCDPRDNLPLLAQMVAAFGGVAGVAGRADALAADLAAALAEAEQTGRNLPPEAVLYLIWRAPWMTVARDTYISRMLATVGWHSWPDLQGGPMGAARYPVVDAAAVAPVQRVLLSSEPYAFGDAHRDEAQALCPEARVHLVDGEAVSWYGPRAAAGLRYLARLRSTLAQAPAIG